MKLIYYNNLLNISQYACFYEPNDKLYYDVEYILLCCILLW